MNDERDGTVHPKAVHPRSAQTESPARRAIHDSGDWPCPATVEVIVDESMGAGMQRQIACRRVRDQHRRDPLRKAGLDALEHFLLARLERQQRLRPRVVDPADQRKGGAVALEDESRAAHCRALALATSNSSATGRSTSKSSPCLRSASRKSRKSWKAMA